MREELLTVIDSFRSCQRAFRGEVLNLAALDRPGVLTVLGIINKYYDLARNGDSMAAEHYRNLEIKADACVQCGHCEARCPFHVRQEERMKEIAAYFGRKGVYDD